MSAPQSLYEDSDPVLMSVKYIEPKQLLILDGTLPEGPRDFLSSQKQQKLTPQNSNAKFTVLSSDQNPDNRAGVAVQGPYMREFALNNSLQTLRKPKSSYRSPSLNSRFVYLTINNSEVTKPKRPAHGTLRSSQKLRPKCNFFIKTSATPNPKSSVEQSKVNKPIPRAIYKPPQYPKTALEELMQNIDLPYDSKHLNKITEDILFFDFEKKKLFTENQRVSHLFQGMHFSDQVTRNKYLRRYLNERSKLQYDPRGCYYFKPRDRPSTHEYRKRLSPRVEELDISPL